MLPNQHLIYKGPIDFDSVWSGLDNQKEIVKAVLGEEWVLAAQQRGAKFRCETDWQYNQNQILVSIWVLCTDREYSWLCLSMQPKTFGKPL